MQYKGIPLRDEFHIDTLYSLHYFEYMSTFSFPGESHDFWEFVCVDKGEVLIGAESHSFILSRGQVAFHKPGEFHWVKANGTIAPNLIVISFSCSDPLMDFFSGKILNVTEPERVLLASVIAEARSFLSGELNNPYQTELFVTPDAPPASAQLIRLYLEEFLIRLYRRYVSATDQTDSSYLPDRTCTQSQRNFMHTELATWDESDSVRSDSFPYSAPDKISRKLSDEELFEQIVTYFEENIAAHITIEQICREQLVSRSRLQRVFQKQCGCGIMEYFMQMKINTAKQMIRTGQLNFTQISEQLGYSSIHYFSRQFKKLSGMTPTEYASSIMAISQIDQSPT